MKTTLSVTALSAALLSLAAGPHLDAPPPDPNLEVDVVVYGGTSAGVIAAYTANLYGKRVLLVEPGRHVGGLSSGGLGYTDIGNKYAVSGLGLDFYRRLGRYYGQFESWTFEPHAAEQVFERYIDEADVEVLYSRRLKSVEKAGTAIRTVTLEYAGKPGQRVRGTPDLVVAAKQFIDASYEGDLMARARVSYTVGREGNSRYVETIDGVQLMTEHQFPDGVDPYVVPGDASSGLLPEISGVGVEPNGTEDKKVQAYNFRMCLCQGDQRVPIGEPDNYDRRRYELLTRLMEKRPWTSLNDGFIISRMPNGKTDWNNRGGFSTDYIGKNWDYAEASHERRIEIWKAHEDYQKGLLYFVATDQRVAEHIRNEMRSWGYCRDEFLDTKGWPHQLYVREARRMVGEYVMTEHNVRGQAVVEDGIGMAAYGMDSHNTQRVVVNGMVKNEGNVEVGGFPPYPISYRAITPKRQEVTNLLVPVALSATHIAFGSIRMEPVFMVLAQAAAVAASMAIDAGVPIQNINVRALQRELRDNPLADGSVPEVLVDNGYEGQVRITGGWTTATDIQGRFGPSVLKNEGKRGSVRFTAPIKEPGRYQAYLYWPRSEGLASNVPAEIRDAAGTHPLTIDMRTATQTAQGGIAQWTLLGEYRFEPGKEAWLEIRVDGVDGTVLADAVLFVPIR
jgi:FAD-dependent oxidoreductase family protein